MPLEKGKTLKSVKAQLKHEKNSRLPWKRLNVNTLLLSVAYFDHTSKVPFIKDEN